MAAVVCLPYEPSQSPGHFPPTLSQCLVIAWVVSTWSAALLHLFTLPFHGRGLFSSLLVIQRSKVEVGRALHILREEERIESQLNKKCSMKENMLALSVAPCNFSDLKIDLMHLLMLIKKSFTLKLCTVFHDYSPWVFLGLLTVVWYKCRTQSVQWALQLVSSPWRFNVQSLKTVHIEATSTNPEGMLPFS